mmetsp:Transcript_14866/g.31923  ORF Transcript_14866/g.31923 Transcript_14866/m.31923 type:complete len:203 (+) Transcript_14866:381-989(+)
MGGCSGWEHVLFSAVPYPIEESCPISVVLSLLVSRGSTARQRLRPLSCSMQMCWCQRHRNAPRGRSACRTFDGRHRLFVAVPFKYRTCHTWRQNEWDSSSWTALPAQLSSRESWRWYKKSGLGCASLITDRQAGGLRCDCCTKQASARLVDTATLLRACAEVRNRTLFVLINGPSPEILLADLGAKAEEECPSERHRQTSVP